MKHNKFSVTFKGMIVGSTMLVPGVSGGTMAMLLGIYDKLIHAVSAFRQQKRESFFFLLLFSLGGGLGIFLLSEPILYLLQKYPLPMHYFFMGTVAGGVPLMLRQAQIRKPGFSLPLYAAAGAALVFLLGSLPPNLFGTVSTQGVSGALLLAATGIFLAAALILPGISVSYLLLMLGLYDKTMSAVSSLDIPFLIPLALGVGAGIIFLTKGLSYAMQKYPQPTYLLILGFVLSSLTEIFPGVPEPSQLLLCVFMLAAGFLIVLLLSREEGSREPARAA